MQSNKSTADFSQAFSMMFQQMSGMSGMQTMPGMQTMSGMPGMQTMTVGENGANTFTTASTTTEDFDGTLAELFLIMRGESSDNINNILERLKNILETNRENKTNFKVNLVKLIKICLYIREPRAGKGERTIFYHIINWMWNNYVDIAKFMIMTLKDFGYWGDFSQLHTIATCKDMKSFLVTQYAEQLISDKRAMLSAFPTKISLAGKWAPREHSSHGTFASAIAKKMYNQLTFKEGKKAYRLTISSLNRELKTVEPLMCQKRWMSIEFDKVPSVAMTKLTKAFQDVECSPFPKDSSLNCNQHYRYQHRRYQSLRRHTKKDEDYIDRNECRTNLITHLINNKKINAKVADLSTIVERYLAGEEKDIIWEAQWESRINEIRELIKTKNITPSIFPMIDLSSSMNGPPKINAIVLGLFCAMMLDTSSSEPLDTPSSEPLDTPSSEPSGQFANMFLTFDTTPQLGTLQREGGLYEKIQGVTKWLSKWGGSTNIKSAFDLLLDIAVFGNVPQDKMPKVLAVFSDMQFDSGDATWNETSYEMIKRRYENSSYTLPHIIFWNLRANTPGFQVKASAPNVTMLSGYSTRMMDLFLTGSMEELQNECNESTNTTDKMNAHTLSLMEKVFSHEMFVPYDDEICNIVNTLSISSHSSSTSSPPSSTSSPPSPPSPPSTSSSTDLPTVSNEMEQIQSLFSQMFNMKNMESMVSNNNNKNNDANDNDNDNELDDELDDDTDKHNDDEDEDEDDDENKEKETITAANTAENTTTKVPENQCTIS
jgi:hypothetical protein